MNEIKDNASEFILGLFSFSSLVLKLISIIEKFRTRKKDNVQENKKLVEEEE